jgi:hypothetical protein
MRTIAAIFALLAVVANAECPNACSGHGDCQDKDQCACYPNFMGADCSERVCPFGLAFVDTPRGDLNHDGEVTDADVPVMWSSADENEAWGYEGAAVAQEAHYYTECSGKGLCDRELGECQCFDGYTGSSCQRTTCPNDCSGHGVCRTVEEIADGALTRRKVASAGGHDDWEGVATPFDYQLWDADKNQACVCDPGYIGADCSMRECPRGDDPLTHIKKACGGTDCVDEVQTATINCNTKTVDAGFFFTWQAWDGMVWTSDEFTVVCAVGSSTADQVKDAIKGALTGIPNSQIEDIDVDVTKSSSGTSSSYAVTVTFTHNSGNVAPLWIDLAQRHKEKDGSTTLLADRVAIGIWTTLPAAFTESNGNKEEITCSGRGVCDYETGLCKCFKGYYHDDCSVQSALAM